MRQLVGLSFPCCLSTLYWLGRAIEADSLTDTLHAVSFMLGELLRWLATSECRLLAVDPSDSKPMVTSRLVLRRTTDAHTAFFFSLSLRLRSKVFSGRLTSMLLSRCRPAVAYQQFSFKAATRPPGVIRCDRNVVGPVDTRCPRPLRGNMPSTTWLVEEERVTRYYDFAAYPAGQCFVVSAAYRDTRGSTDARERVHRSRWPPADCSHTNCAIIHTHTPSVPLSVKYLAACLSGLH